MKDSFLDKLKNTSNSTYLAVFIMFLLVLTLLFLIFPTIFSSSTEYPPKKEGEKETQKEVKKEEKKFTNNFPKLDKALYDKKMLEIANNPLPKPPTTKIVKDPKTGKETTVTVEPKPLPPTGWPVKAPYPNDGAILPFRRIIAYYGNLYSTKMGVLGEYKEDVMLEKLQHEVDKWNAADPNTPVQPALHYIAVVAQGSAGKDGKYRARMPGTEIDKVIAIAEKIDAIVFLDIQVGLSNLQAEIPVFEKYLKMPQVHLGIDPEFSMKTGAKPGKVVGTLDAADINFAAEYLAKLVKENNLPPKVLVVHRYTQKMVTNSKLIQPLPEVQIVMHMDGWGGAAKKVGTYKNFIYPEPVQFTGFKLFYKNDLWDKGTVLMTPQELLKLSPKPLYVQYQ